MKKLRQILTRLLGFEGYMRLASRSYLFLVQNGFLKKQYPELFYLKQLINPGAYCLDIGANLGYYSTLLSRLTGPKGHVYAVEPVPVFQSLWQQNVKQSGVDNLTLLPYALGGREGSVQMGTPSRDGVLRHGLTKVVSPGTETYERYYDVQMKVPDLLFSEFPRLDFVKCDVEGYEHVVFTNMTETLRKHRPIIQTELNGAQNRGQVTQALVKLDYEPHILIEGKLQPCPEKEMEKYAHQDFYFIPR
jgi:FkbM family methyltransferase